MINAYHVLEPGAPFERCISCCGYYYRLASIYDTPYTCMLVVARKHLSNCPTNFFMKSYEYHFFIPKFGCSFILFLKNLRRSLCVLPIRWMFMTYACDIPNNQVQPFHFVFPTYRTPALSLKSHKYEKINTIESCHRPKS